MEEIRTKMIKLIDANPDYKDFYSCRICLKKLIFKIEEYNEIEYLFYEFKKMIYYCLQNISLINIILKNEEDIDFSKIQLISECKKITMYYKKEIMIVILFEVF